MKTHYTIIIEEKDQATANTYCKANLDTVGGENTFASGLSPTSETPYTHYFCGYNLSDIENQLMDIMLAGLSGWYKSKSNDKSLDEWLTQLNLNQPGI